MKEPKITQSVEKWFVETSDGRCLTGATLQEALGKWIEQEPETPDVRERSIEVDED